MPENDNLQQAGKSYTEIEKQSAYKEALSFAKSHYENFPVVSFLVPEELRKHVAIIYWFARTADDFADEGELAETTRLIELNKFENRLRNLITENFEDPLELALYSTIKEKNLSPVLFFDLLKAFKQDVVKKRYNNFDDVLEYCKYSANPVGRLILELSGIRDEKAFRYSDKICTALQLTNFLQDTAVDYRKGRIYLPADEMEKFGVSEKMFELNENNLNLKKLLTYNVNRAQRLFDEGKHLFTFLHGLLKYEIRWTVLGGQTVLDRIRKNDYDVLNKRPQLSKKDFLVLLLKAFIK